MAAAGCSRSTMAATRSASSPSISATGALTRDAVQSRRPWRRRSGDPWPSIRPARRSSSETVDPGRRWRASSSHRPRPRRRRAARSPWDVGANPFSIAFSRDGNLRLRGRERGNRDRGLQRRRRALASSPRCPDRRSIRATRFRAAYATDSAGRLFIANYGADQVRVFTTSGGVPTGVTGNPFPSGLVEPSDPRRPAPGRVLPGGGPRRRARSASTRSAAAVRGRR